MAADKPRPLLQNSLIKTKIFPHTHLSRKVEALANIFSDFDDGCKGLDIMHQVRGDHLQKIREKTKKSKIFCSIPKQILMKRS